MLRICLIVAIVAGLAAGALSIVKVKEVMVTTMTERDDWHKKSDQEESAKKQALTKLKKTETDLAGTKKKLDSTEKELQTTTARAEDLDKQKTDLTAKLEKTRTERDTAQQTLAQWDQIGLKPSQVKGVIADLGKTTKQRDASYAENKILNKKVNELKEELAKLLPEDQPPLLPVGLKGKVVAVDPKYEFVILDIGREQGVIERGEMLVNRDGRLVAKVKIAAVLDKKCIANVMPTWKQKDVMEGDQVIY